MTINPVPRNAPRGGSAPDYPPGPRAPGAGLALPAVSRAEVEALNAFYRRRPPLAFQVAGRSATVTASWPPASDDDVSGRYRVDITVDDAPGKLILSRSLITALIDGLDPDQRLDRLDPYQLAILLELAVADALSALEGTLGSLVTIDSVRAAADDAGGASSFSFTIAIDGLRSSSGELRLQPGQTIRLSRLLDRYGAASMPEVELPVPVRMRVAATTCSVGEIATLLPGDVVMADDCVRKARAAVAVVAEHLVAPVDITASGARMAAPLTRGQGSLWEWSMENGAERPQADALQKTDLDDIPVRLMFELGRVVLSLAEIRQLAPGALIPMPRPADESVEISANGRRIGRGSLVRIGDNLGVRITRLFQDV
jgi:type III secretion protein Q